MKGLACLVTGAAGGIGGAVVRAFEQAGASVLGVDVTGEGVLRADVSRADGAERAVHEAVARFGRLDVVATMHGISGRRLGDGPVDVCTEEGWDAVLDANLKSVYRVCRFAVPELRRSGGGAIVTLGSVLGLVGGDEDFATHAYAASKAGVVGLTRAIAATYAREGIRCNVVCPGLIATPMSARAQASPEIRARLAQLQPLTGDFGAPEDVAQAVLYLASPASRFVTGTVLTVDGGWTTR